MGVHGLWTILAPAAKQLKGWSMDGKILAIDASIWIIQMKYGYAKIGGEEVEIGYLIGIFKRILKLLLYGIKPVFVFDGKFPEIKRQTLIKRAELR